MGRAVYCNPQIDLPDGIRCLVNENLPHLQALDVYAQYLSGSSLSSGGIVGPFDPSGFATSADQHLGFDYHPSPQPRRDFIGIVRS